jgi:hypothetical protein
MLQQAFLRLALFVASGGQASFEGKILICTLGAGQQRKSTFPAMATGQSFILLGLREKPRRTANFDLRDHIKREFR